MSKDKKTWADLTPAQRKAVVVAGFVELVVTALALRDLHHRSESQVRGPKALWRLSFAVQPFGPLAYFVLGRRGDPGLT
jgi:hypothetical protein